MREHLWWWSSGGVDPPQKKHGKNQSLALLLSVNAFSEVLLEHFELYSLLKVTY